MEAEKGRLCLQSKDVDCINCSADSLNCETLGNLPKKQKVFHSYETPDRKLITGTSSHQNSGSLVQANSYSLSELLTGQSEETLKLLRQLRILLKYRSMCHENDEAPDNLLILNPKNDDKGQSVSNAMNKDKAFLKVHYLKGYFLLNYMAESFGENQFIALLQKFVLKYHGQLITSEDFIDFVYSSFSNSIKETKTELSAKWLNDSSMNAIPELNTTDNYLINLSEKHKNVLISSKAKMPHKLKCLCSLKYPEQIQLLFELLLEHKGRLNRSLMTTLYEYYEIEKRNCEVQHSWCELIIKHHYKPGLDFVRAFLNREFAMGVYIYGELIISPYKLWNKLALEVFDEVKDVLDTNTRSYIREMIRPDI